MKLLIPTDGSPSALHAVKFAVQMMSLACDLEVHLLHVEPVPDSWELRSRLGAGEIADIQRCRADDALKDAKLALQEAGVKFQVHIAQGEVAEVIAHKAEELGCHQIVMGTRGMTSLGNMMLGSISSKVLHRVRIPVTLVR